MYAYNLYVIYIKIIYNLCINYIEYFGCTTENYKLIILTLRCFALLMKDSSKVSMNLFQLIER